MTLSRRATHALAALLLCCAAAPVPALAQQYPSKAVRMIVPFAAGGPADFVARLLGAKLSEAWGQPLVIENRGGAGGNIGTAAVARSAPDGYTILLTTSGLMCNPSLYKNAGYGPFKDFAPVTVVGNSATVVVRHQTGDHGCAVRTRASRMRAQTTRCVRWRTESAARFA